MTSEPLGLYIHLPFCRRRCTYCAFAISTRQSEEDRYHAALLREIEGCEFRGRIVETVYFGGGTPSLIPFAHLREVLTRMRTSFALLSEAEITIEANPEDVTSEGIALWRDQGINRISLGVQSFHDQELYPLGRDHGGERARRTVDLTVASGARVSLDLIVGLPNQTSRSFAASLRLALESGVGHLSLYMLDLEPGSVLEEQVRLQRVTLPDDEETAAMYLWAIEEAEAAGFRHYEISNFAQPGQQSRHNLKYWNRQPYIGFGLGAHSFVGHQRWANTRELDDYLSRTDTGSSLVSFRESLAELERSRESIFLGLRQSRGMGYSELVSLRGEEASAWVSRGLNEGWLRRAGDRVAFTGPGFLLSNDYISQLF